MRTQLQLRAPQAVRAALITLFLPLALLAWSPITRAQSAPETYAEVRLRLDDRADLENLAHHGVVLDHVRREVDGRWGTVVLNAWELGRLRASGHPHEVLVPDLGAAYAARPRPTPADLAAYKAAALARGGVEGFGFGSMGGFYTLDEVVAELDTMAMLYPDLVTARASIGQSVEGRDIWMVKISDNPTVDEDEPEVLYDALHHPSEPLSMAVAVHFMYYLLERYGSDPRATSLVDNRELYFVPVVNPDGYVYNEATNPNGGGMWRKNRRANEGGSFGVDLNRNYGYAWGFDDVGSSPIPSSTRYRGPAPFSEPETQAIRDFIEGRAFVTAFSLHSAGPGYIYPWSYDRLYTPDDLLFEDYSFEMIADNGYVYGTIWDIANFTANGTTMDWMYGEQETKPQILAWSPEVGTTLWPSSANILPVAEENVEACLVVAEAAGDLQPPTSTEPNGNVPDRIALRPIYPNPFGSSTTVGYRLTQPASVTLTVYDLLGREVARLVDAVRPAGEHTATWDGRDAGERRVGAGVYVVRLRAGGATQSRKVLLLR